jgi:hypothetical protein
MASATVTPPSAPKPAQVPTYTTLITGTAGMIGSHLFETLRGPGEEVGELTLRGCYLGSNVSYNVKRERVSYAAALAARPPLDPRQSDRKRAQIAGQADNDASASCDDAAAGRSKRGRSSRCWRHAPPAGAILAPRQRPGVTPRV